MTSLHPDQVAHYRAHGFVDRIDALTPAEVQHYRSWFERLEQEALARHDGRWTERHLEPWTRTPHPFEDFFLELALHPRVLDAVQSVLGPDLLIRNADVFTREPGQVAAVSWHVDSTMHGPAMDQMLTAWIALTPSTPDNGALQFAGGGHADGVHRGTVDGLNLSEAQIDGLVASSLHTSTMQPGQLSLHHIHLPHRSGANTTSERRIAYVIRFMTPEVSVEQAECGTAVLVRGRCPTRHFRLRPLFPVTWTAQETS